MSLTVATSQGIRPPMRPGSLRSPHSRTSSVSSDQPEMVSKYDDDETQLLSVSWNQDYECFAAGTSCGFRLYNCDPFGETIRRDLEGGGFGIVEMLNRSNIIALVGGGANPQYPPNKVMIWDDHQSRGIGEFTFRSNVHAVRLRKDLIVVVLEHKIYVYNFNDLTVLHQIETLSNPRGLCCLSHNLSTSVLACPGLRQGQVRVEHFGLKVTNFINAHDSSIACFTLTTDGLILATASIKGTLVRIFNIIDGTCLQEVRRGTEKTEIYSIALSSSAQWLAVSSSKGTLHIFNLRVQVVGEGYASDQGPAMVRQDSSTSLNALSPNMVSNPNFSLSFMKGVLPKYFRSEWSFAQFHLPEITRNITAFGAQNTVIIVGMDGSFYRCAFDPVSGGEMVLKECIKFLKVDSPQPKRTTT